MEASVIAQPIRQKTRSVGPCSPPRSPALRRRQAMAQWRSLGAAEMAHLRVAERLNPESGPPFFLRIYDSRTLGTVVVMTELDEDTGWQLTSGAAEAIKAIASKFNLDADRTVWLAHSGTLAGSAERLRPEDAHFFVQVLVKPNSELYWRHTPTALITRALGDRVLNRRAFR